MYPARGRGIFAFSSHCKAPDARIKAARKIDFMGVCRKRVARPDVDAIVLATPADSHLRDTLIAAAAGKHVLAEKPMAGAVAACDAMIAACHAAKVSLAVVKTERYRKLTLAGEGV